jgi:hypothetical protein
VPSLDLLPSVTSVFLEMKRQASVSGSLPRGVFGMSTSGEYHVKGTVVES